jgi:hypothetical protein
MPVANPWCVDVLPIPRKTFSLQKLLQFYSLAAGIITANDGTPTETGRVVT